MNIERSFLALILWLFYHLQETSCFVDPITGSAVVIGAGILYGIKRFYSDSCDKKECCSNEKWIPKDMHVLANRMNRRLFGQHIAKSTVLSAITSHIQNKEPQKALTLSFHGLPGSGKNYLSSMIANSYFNKGENSKYYHFFNGRTEFPNENHIAYYQQSLKKKIIESLIQCPESIFVFDEIDMMPSGVLNVLVPFLDYGLRQNVYDSIEHHDVKINKAIFIFLSNTGSSEIVETLTELWENGKKRDDTRLSDFENLISLGAFNEKGGFYKSHTIRTNLIDHYVPFLPLEEKHVRLCIEKEFNERGISTPSTHDIEEVMEYVTFAPPHNLFANAGCKRLSQKVATIVYRKKERDY